MPQPPSVPPPAASSAPSLPAPSAPLSSELLGFPPGARVLLVNCDDLGMRRGVNSAVVESVEQGIAASCSLMTICPGTRDAARLLRRHPHLPYGLHLTLVRDSPANRWAPAAGRERVPSLLDPEGQLFTATPAGRAALLRGARIEEVEAEFRAQLAFVQELRTAPTHLDFHCLADGGRDDIFDLAVALAGEYGLAVRAWGDRARARLRARRLPVVDHPFLDSFSLPLADKHERYASLVRALRPGLTEWAVHPGTDDAEARALEPDGLHIRTTDHAFLTSPAARELLADAGVQLVGYEEVRRAWNDRAGDEDGDDDEEDLDGDNDVNLPDLLGG